MGHFFVFLKIFVQLSLRFIGHLKKPEIVNLTFLSSLVFGNYVILGGHILNISKAKYPKLLFHLQLSYQLPADLLQEFCIHSTYLIFHYN